MTGPALRTRQRSTVLEPTETRRAFARVRAACAPSEAPELQLTTPPAAKMCAPTCAAAA